VLPLFLAQLAHEKEKPTPDDLDALKAYLDLRLLSHACSDPEGRLQPSEKPGYLQSSVSGQDLFVPFHLAPYFPSGATLETAVRVATEVSLVASNPICISGSTTFLKSLREIGDLDFCEYHLATPEQLPDAVRAKGQKKADLALIEVKCRDKKHHSPWSSLSSEFKTDVLDTSGEVPASWFKMDFVSESELGVLPATSMVLPLGADHEAGNARKSFAYQEAVLCGGGPPRSLLRPESFGDYLDWLIEDARKRLFPEDTTEAREVRGPKALKRLLSAMLLLGETDAAEDVLQGINQPALQAVVARGRHQELEAMIPHLPEDQRARLCPLIKKATEGLGFAEDQVAEAAEIALQIGQDMLNQIDGWMKPAGDVT